MVALCATNQQEEALPTLEVCMPRKPQLIFLGSLSTACLALLGPVYAGCTVFQHRDFKGAKWHLGSGDELQVAGEPCGKSSSHGSSGEIYYQPSWNDQISSFKVTSGCTIRLWEHAGVCKGSGHKFTSNRSYSYVGDRWNDKTSYVECWCSK